MSVAALSTDTVVAVIGAGTMGAGIAQIAASAGHPVLLFDTRPEAAVHAVGTLRTQFAKLAAKGKLSQEAAEAAGGRLTAAATLAELAAAGLIVEAIVEDLAAKQSLFRELEGIVGPDCLFGTNTSSISVTAIGAALARPERLAGLHFFNPAPLMALVEIVSGLATSRAVADTLFDTAAAWGKSPVHAKSTPGFIVNRVARPYYAEALRLLNEGAADCATLDAVMREAGGFRMGPFELMDLIGHDVNFAVTRSVWSAFFHDPRFLPSLIQQELVEAGFLGRKSGRGFYAYPEGAVPPSSSSGAVPPAPTFSAAQPKPAHIEIHGGSPAAQALAARLGLTCGAAHADGRLATAGTVGDVALYLTDGRSATRRAAESGVPNTVLLDLALDYATAKTLAVAVADQCDPAATNEAIGLLQAAGLNVARLDDVPGLAVMRTVAMLANEAADAVNQGVCTVAGADAAMRLGVNYPRGPLAWADAVGLDHVVAVLRHLGESYGEDRYRISPLLQRKVQAGRTFHD
jgi:3-hydroxybutyryl-CoA dehydrogenase